MRIEPAHWFLAFLGALILIIAGCAGGSKPSLKALIHSMAQDCIHGPKRQKAEPSTEGNKELQATVVVECAEPPVKVVYGT